MGRHDDIVEALNASVRSQLYKIWRERLTTHFRDLQNIDQKEVDMYNMLYNTNKTIEDIENEIKFICSSSD